MGKSVFLINVMTDRNYSKMESVVTVQIILELVTVGGIAFQKFVQTNQSCWKMVHVIFVDLIHGYNLTYQSSRYSQRKNKFVDQINVTKDKSF